MLFKFNFLGWLIYIQYFYFRKIFSAIFFNILGSYFVLFICIKIHYVWKIFIKSLENKLTIYYNEKCQLLAFFCVERNLNKGDIVK